MQEPCRACLRPAFTRMLAERLAMGDCIELTGPHGQGRRRTLKDLRRCLPAALRVLQADLRDHPRSLASLLHALGTQDGYGAAASLGELLDALARRADRSLLILHNFDALRPGGESGYDERFFALLNGIGERPNLALLCVSERRYRDGPLRLEGVCLPPLSGEEIADELRRRGMAETALRDTARRLLRQPAPYTAIGAHTGGRSP